MVSTFGFWFRFARVCHDFFNLVFGALVGTLSCWECVKGTCHKFLESLNSFHGNYVVTIKGSLRVALKRRNQQTVVPFHQLVDCAPITPTKFDMQVAVARFTLWSTIENVANLHTPFVSNS